VGKQSPDQLTGFFQDFLFIFGYLQF
jgi:hypothetical protein